MVNGWGNSAVSLTAFILWLIAFPMEGFLLNASEQSVLLYFLVPHTAGLFSIARFMPPEVFDRISRVGIIATAILTAAMPFATLQYSRILLILIGAGSALLTVRATVLLKPSRRPAASAGIGIAAGNALVYVLNKTPIPATFKFLIIAAGILVVAWFTLGPPEDRNAPHGSLKAPFIYIFYLTGGLMYAAIAPHYFTVAWSQGAELAFYVLTALACIRLLEKNMDALFCVGVAGCMLSFAFYHLTGAAFINLSMFAIQTAFALIDLYLLGLLVGSARPVRAFGYGMGACCLAIICGKLVGDYTARSAAWVLAASNIMLTGAVLMFYFEPRNRLTALEPKAALQPTAKLIDALGSHQKWFEKRLSAQELAVVQQVLQYKTFKQTALELGISESSVKTYMKRAYEKTGVTSKEGLIALISGVGKSEPKVSGAR